MKEIGKTHPKDCSCAYCQDSDTKYRGKGMLGPDAVTNLIKHTLDEVIKCEDVLAEVNRLASEQLGYPKGTLEEIASGQRHMFNVIATLTSQWSEIAEPDPVNPSNDPHYFTHKGDDDA